MYVCMYVCICVCSTSELRGTVFSDNSSISFWRLYFLNRILTSYPGTLPRHEPRSQLPSHKMTDFLRLKTKQPLYIVLPGGQ